jgi:hypothetical protein
MWVRWLGRGLVSVLSCSMVRMTSARFREDERMVLRVIRSWLLQYESEDDTRDG